MTRTRCRRRADDRRATRPLSRRTSPDVEPLERRQDDVRRQAAPLLVPDDPGARPAPAAAGEPALGRVAAVPRRPAARRPGRRRPSRPRSRSCSPARSRGPIRRVADATRALAADETHDAAAAEGTRELASLAQAFNEMAEQLAASREAERNVPALGEPRAEDAADRDPRLRRGPRRGRVRARRRRRATISLEARRLERLVRDLLDLARMNRQRVLGRAASRSTSRRSRARRWRGTRRAAREFGVDARGDGERVVGRGRPRPRCSRSPRTWSRTRCARRRRAGRVTVARAAGGSPSPTRARASTPDDLPHAFDRFFLYDKAGASARSAAASGSRS